MTTDQQGNMLIGDSKNDRIQVIGVLGGTVQEEMMVNIVTVQENVQHWAISFKATLLYL